MDATNHNLHLTADAGFDRPPDLPADYGDIEARWIADPQDAPAPSRDLGPEPAAPVIRGPAWYERGAVQLAVLVTLLVAFTVYPAVGAVRRIRHHPRLLAPRSARWLAVLGPTSIIGTLLYLLALLATAAKITGPVLLGRPIPWLALQLLAYATVATTLVVAYTLVSARRHHYPGARIRLSLLTAAGLLFIPWALYWGLLIP